MDIKDFLGRVGKGLGLKQVEDIIDIEKLGKCLEDSDDILAAICDIAKNSEDGEINIHLTKEGTNVQAGVNGGQSLIAFLNLCDGIIKHSDGQISKELLIALLIATNVGEYNDK